MSKQNPAQKINYSDAEWQIVDKQLQSLNKTLQQTISLSQVKTIMLRVDILSNDEKKAIFQANFLDKANFTAEDLLRLFRLFTIAQNKQQGDQNAMEQEKIYQTVKFKSEEQKQQTNKQQPLTSQQNQTQTTTSQHPSMKQGTTTKPTSPTQQLGDKATSILVNSKSNGKSENVLANYYNDPIQESIKFLIEKLPNIQFVISKDEIVKINRQIDYVHGILQDQKMILYNVTNNPPHEHAEQMILLIKEQQKHIDQIYTQVNNLLNHHKMLNNINFENLVKKIKQMQQAAQFDKLIHCEQEKHANLQAQITAVDIRYQQLLQERSQHMSSLKLNKTIFNSFILGFCKAQKHYSTKKESQANNINAGSQSSLKDPDEPGEENQDEQNNSQY